VDSFYALSLVTSALDSVQLSDRQGTGRQHDALDLSVRIESIVPRSLMIVGGEPKIGHSPFVIMRIDFGGIRALRQANRPTTN
jgi:hypothetical protein